MKNILDKIKSMSLDMRLVLIVLILIINGLLVFKPGVLKNDSSYAAIIDKKNKLGKLNTDISMENSKNKDVMSDLIDKREESIEYNERAMKSKKEIDEAGLVFHLPSILIRLEDSAKSNSLKLAVEYNQISYENLEGENITYIDDIEKEKEGKEKPLIEEVEEDSKTHGQEDEEKTEEKISEENLEESSEKNIEVTKIPIKISGKYDGIRSFINDLDELNYIEPSKIEMKSKGKIIDANIIISIFHGDIFRDL